MKQSIGQVSLPMYDYPEIRAETDAWWQGISRHMVRAGLDTVPEILQHDRPLQALWDAPDLFMTQCCGFDLMHRYRGHLQPLVITDWAVEGCEAGRYFSRIVVHEDSPYTDLEALRGSTAVINGPESHSGMNALFSSVNPLSRDGQFFQSIQISGAHVDSLYRVQQQQADVAAIDCVTYALLERYRPAAVGQLRTIAQSRQAPALPYATLTTIKPSQFMRMQSALAEAFNDPALSAVREALLLKGALFDEVRFQGYREIREQFSFDSRLLDVLIRSD